MGVLQQSEHSSGCGAAEGGPQEERRAERQAQRASQADAGRLKKREPGQACRPRCTLKCATMKYLNKNKNAAQFNYQLHVGLTVFNRIFTCEISPVQNSTRYNFLSSSQNNSNNWNAQLEYQLWKNTISYRRGKKKNILARPHHRYTVLTIWDGTPPKNNQCTAKKMQQPHNESACSIPASSAYILSFPYFGIATTRPISI